MITSPGFRDCVCIFVKRRAGVFNNGNSCLSKTGLGNEGSSSFFVGDRMRAVQITVIVRVIQTRGETRQLVLLDE
jgi:hypothetical protein